MPCTWSNDAHLCCFTSRSTSSFDSNQMLARHWMRESPARIPGRMLLLAIAAELGAAGYVFYEGLVSIVTSLL